MTAREQFSAKAQAAGKAIAQLVLRRRREKAQVPNRADMDSSTTAAGAAKPGKKR